MTMTKEKTYKKTNTKTKTIRHKRKTNTKCFQDPMYAILFKCRGFKDINYGISSIWGSTNQLFQRWTQMCCEHINMVSLTLFKNQEKNYYETGRWAEIAAAGLIGGCWWDAGTCLSASPGSNIKSMAALGLFWCWEFMGVRNEDDCELQEHTAQHSGEL